MILLLLLLAVVGGPAGAQHHWRASWEGRPEVSRGKQLKVEARAVLLAGIYRHPGDGEGSRYLDFRRRRAGVQGRVGQFEFEFDGEVAGEDSGVRDAFVNWRRFKNLEVRAGQFKAPFGRDQLAPMWKLDHAFRSRVGHLLTPGRDVGAMAHGRFWGKRFDYQAGVFRSGPAVRLVHKPKWMKAVEFGGALAYSNLEEGRNGIRGRDVHRDTFFPRVWVQGRRLRFGLEGEYKRGPLRVEGEWMGVRDERRGQGYDYETLPALLARGYWAGAAWRFHGTSKGRRWEAVGRWDAISFSAGDPRGAQAILRATDLSPAWARTVSGGVNWHYNRNVRVQMQVIRETVLPFGARLGTSRWIPYLGLQFAM